MKTPPPLSLTRITARNLYRQPVRTLLTAFGVAIGVSAIVALGAVSRGLRGSIDNALNIDSADLMVFQAGIAADLFSNLDEAATRKKFADFPEIKSATAGITHIVRFDEQYLIVVGLYPDEFADVTTSLVEGRAFESKDEIVIGSEFQRRMKFAVGDEIDITGATYTITGVIETGVVFFDSGVVMHIDLVRGFRGWSDGVTNFSLRLVEGADPDALIEQIETTYPELAVIARADQYGKIDQGLAASDNMVWVISALALVIGCLVVGNTMWMSVSQRTREIGILRAIGWSRKRVMGIIICESIGIGAVGCVLGFAMGFGLAEGTRFLQDVQSFLDPDYSLFIFARALGVAILLSVIGSLPPAIKSARISPAEALRYE